MIYFCCDERRRKKLLDENERRRALGEATLNGIDYLEVLDREAPPGIPRQRTLLVRAFEPLPAFTRDNVSIDGGERVEPVGIEWAYRADALPGSLGLSVAEKNYFNAFPAAEKARLLIVRTDSTGDFSNYRFALIQVAGSSTPPDGFDPVFSTVNFSFKVECPSDFDCREKSSCPTPPSASPPINYLAKDYAGFRRLLLDRIALLAPDWRERSPADLGVALVELLAYVGDRLSYQQDATVTEAYLGTARRRVSIRRHARLLDYPMHDGCNARTWVHFTCEPNTDGVVLPAGTIVLTKVPSEGLTLPSHWQDLESVRRAQPVVFATRHDLALFTAHNRLSFYSWGDERCCLPKGATRATLKGHYPGLMAGEVLVFQEVLGPRTGREEDADPSRRHAVRLTHVQCFAAANQPLRDPLNNQDVTEISWSEADALPFPFCLSAQTDAGHAGAPREDVSIALGNIALADHGEEIRDPKDLGTVPVAKLRRPRPRNADCCDETLGEYLPPRFQPVIADWTEPLTFATPAKSSPLFTMDYKAALGTALNQHKLPPTLEERFRGEGVLFSHPLSVQGAFRRWAVSDGRQAFRIERDGTHLRIHAVTEPAAAALRQDPRSAVPAVYRLEGLKDGRTTPWDVQRDLLSSLPGDAHFVVEPEDDGNARVRFGDNLHGRRPESGTRFTARYRIGNGAAGNIGAYSLAHVVNDDPAVSNLAEISNPLPAEGGCEPESSEEVRQRAPEAFRKQERAITEQDYADVTERDRQIQRAAGTFRWTGSWLTVFVTADRVGGRPVDQDFKDALLRRLEYFRMAGHDLDVDAPRPVSLEILMHVCVQPGYFRSDVREALLEVFSRGLQPNGQRGVFHPDNFTFGQPVYLSRLYAAAQSVPGVASVHIEKFQRQGHDDATALRTGRLELGRLEIARCDNARNFPEHGVFHLELGGGK
jgi:Baseplate J-like protein